MIVTTFSPEGYEYYGKRFIETYRKHCSEELIIYVEDDLELDGIETRSLFDVPGCVDFLEAVKNYSPDHYRRDVNKFSRKVFAITDACKNGGKVAFIGADTVFFKDVPDNLISKVLDGKYVAYLGRKGYHSETDFLAFDTDHPVNKLFQNLFINTYLTGAFQHLKYYCDSDVFDYIRTVLNPPSNNLNKSGEMQHPFNKSIVGRYMDHLKGPLRKKVGNSHNEKVERIYANQ